LRFARLRDFAVERRQAALLLGQEALLQQLADDALDRFRQAPLAFAAAGSAGSQVRHQASTLPGTADQDIYLPPGQAQRLGCRIGGFMPDRLRLRQRPDDLRRRRARSHASSGRVATPCSAIGGCLTPCSPRFGAHEY
jgi:hypothetical protein